MFEQILDESDEVRLGTVVGDQDRSPSAFGLYRDEQITSADAYVLVILSHGHPRADRQRRAGILEQLLALFIKANNGLFPLERSGVEIEQIVHSLPILFGHFANAPHQLAPRLEAVFFSNRRTVSRLMGPISGCACAACSSKPIVQLLAPTGGAEHAKAEIFASTSVSY